MPLNSAADAAFESDDGQTLLELAFAEMPGEPSILLPLSPPLPTSPTSAVSPVHALYSACAAADAAAVHVSQLASKRGGGCGGGGGGGGVSVSTTVQQLMHLQDALYQIETGKNVPSSQQVSNKYNTLPPSATSPPLHHHHHHHHQYHQYHRMAESISPTDDVSDEEIAAMALAAARRLRQAALSVLRNSLQQE